MLCKLMTYKTLEFEQGYRTLFTRMTSVEPWRRPTPYQITEYLQWRFWLARKRAYDQTAVRDTVLQCLKVAEETYEGNV